MKYLQIEIKTTVENIDEVVSNLYSIGLTDLVIDDPRDIDDILDKKTGYEWDYIDDSVLELKNSEPKVTLYFDFKEEGEPDYAETVKRNDEKYDEIKEVTKGIATSVDFLVNDDTDWKDTWKQYFKPKKVSERIVVKPTWENYEKKDDELILEIDPGMAFGTGTHETTSLCIRMLEKYMKKGEKVLDVGCGSGVLSIAASLLGASECLGVDIDPVAVEVSKENIELNHVENISRAEYGDLTKGIDFVADTVVANLMADLVIMLSEDVARCMKSGGYYISSGILVEKIPVVREKIEACGFEIVEIKEDGMWSAIVARKN